MATARNGLISAQSSALQHGFLKSPALCGGAVSTIDIHLARHQDFSREHTEMREAISQAHNNLIALTGKREAGERTAARCRMEESASAKRAAAAQEALLKVARERSVLEAEAEATAEVADRAQSAFDLADDTWQQIQQFRDTHAAAAEASAKCARESEDALKEAITAEIESNKVRADAATWHDVAEIGIFKYGEDQMVQPDDPIRHQVPPVCVVEALHPWHCNTQVPQGPMQYALLHGIASSHGL